MTAKTDEEKIEAPIIGMKTIPLYYDNNLLMGGFVGLVRFAFNTDDIVGRYKTETGVDIRKILIRSPFVKMIDDACGFDGHEEFAAFADWVNVNLWGQFTGDMFSA